MASSSGDTPGAAEASTSTEPEKDAAVAEDETDSNECAVCLQNCTYPVKLPTCAHTFCFLCIKGVAFRSGRCPLCRALIPPTFIDNARITGQGKSIKQKKVTDTDGEAKKDAVDVEEEDEFEWFYEARNGGWWRYETRQETDLETAFVDGKERLELLIAGHMYVADLRLMHQYRKDQPTRRRAIKRNLSSVAIDIKGIAGLRID